MEHEGRLVAFYADYRSSERYQPPRMAVSDEPGCLRGGYAGGAAARRGEGAEIFRDPFVSYEEVVGACLWDPGWQMGRPPRCAFTSPTTSGPGKTLVFSLSLKGNKGAANDPGMAWECPQYAWGLGVLFVGMWRPDVGTMNVLAIKGSEQDGRLVVHGVEPADHGPTSMPLPSCGRPTAGTCCGAS